MLNTHRVVDVINGKISSSHGILSWEFVMGYDIGMVI